MTTSRTARSYSQAAKRHNSLQVVPNRSPSNRKSVSQAFATTTANIFLCTLMPATLYSSSLLPPGGGSGERAPNDGRTVTHCHRAPEEGAARTPWFQRAFRIKHVNGLN
ncbi:MAG: hypothetical protein ACJ73N_03405 [Bryobacteraceae bacterium]